MVAKLEARAWMWCHIHCCVCSLLSGRLKPLFRCCISQKTLELCLLFSECIEEVALDFRHAKYLAKNLKLSKESSLLLCKAASRGWFRCFFSRSRPPQNFLATVSIFFYLPSKSSALLGADIEDVFGLEAYLTLFGKSHLKVSYNANLNFSR